TGPTARPGSRSISTCGVDDFPPAHESGLAGGGHGVVLVALRNSRLRTGVAGTSGTNLDSASCSRTPRTAFSSSGLMTVSCATTRWGPGAPSWTSLVRVWADGPPRRDAGKARITASHRTHVHVACTPASGGQKTHRGRLPRAVPPNNRR